MINCIELAGCKDMIQTNLNMDDTECIDTCTANCKGLPKDKLDKCLTDCLKNNCSDPGNQNSNPTEIVTSLESGYSILTPQVLMLIFGSIGVIACLFSNQ